LIRRKQKRPFYCRYKLRQAIKKKRKEDRKNHVLNRFFSLWYNGIDTRNRNFEIIEMIDCER
jgi:hypothetical protein